MASLNKVMIIGNLGRDPEVSYTPSGMAITKFSVATTDARVDRNTNERTERTEWHRITVFGKTAENCGRFLAKGSQVYVEGRLQTSSYEKDGITRYSTDIIGNQVTFLSKRNADAGAQQAGGGFGDGQNSYQGQGQGQGQGGGYNQNQNQNQGGGYGSAGGHPGSYNNAPQQPPAPPQQPASQPQQGGFDQGGGYGGGDPGFSNPPDDDIPF
jgi:single-strand DNA-binding protein